MTGSISPGWRAAVVHGDLNDLRWEVHKDAFAPSRPHVLALTRTGTNREASNLCVRDDVKFRDGVIEASLFGDEGVGIMFRMSGDANGYLFRVNPGEGNFRLFKVVNGVRTALAASRLRYADEDGWHRLSITARGPTLTGVLEGHDRRGAHQNNIEHEDATFATAGPIALWTRADSKGRFDDLVVHAAPAAASSPARRPVYRL